MEAINSLTFMHATSGIRTRTEAILSRVTPTGWSMVAYAVEGIRTHPVLVLSEVPPTYWATTAISLKCAIGRLVISKYPAPILAFDFNEWTHGDSNPKATWFHCGLSTCC